MPQNAAEIAKDLTIAAIQAQPAVIAVAAGKYGDAAELGREVGKVFDAIYDAIKGHVPASKDGAP